MGIFKRGNRFYARYRDDSGRMVRLSLGPGITTEAQANKVWRKLEEQRLSGRLALMDPSQARLDGFIEEYLSHREGLDKAPDTIRKDRQALNSLMDVLGRGTLLRSIRQKQVDQWARVLLAKKTSPQTINSYLRHIKAALGVAVEWELLKDPPRLRRLKEPERLPRAILPTDVERLLRKESDKDKRALWSFVLWTGLRRQEVIGLRWEHCQLDGPEPWCRIIGKGDKERIVPLLPPAVDAMGRMPQADMGPVWVFQVKRTRRPVKPWAISTWFKAAARRAGLPDARFHDLRHTAFTWMAARGVSERIIQEIAGHVSITTTQIYTKGMARIAHLYQEAARGLDMTQK